MNLIEHAEYELNKILNTCEEGEDYNTQKAMNDAILSVVKIFSDQQFSGFTAGYAINALNKLLSFKPISVLTGEDDEWVEIGDENNKPLYQNRRCSTVFKNNEYAYDIEGRTFSIDEGRTWFINKDSKQIIKFPYDVNASQQNIVIPNQELRTIIAKKIMSAIPETSELAVADEDLSDFRIAEFFNDLGKLDLLYNTLANLCPYVDWKKYRYDDSRMWNIINIILANDDAYDPTACFSSDFCENDSHEKCKCTEFEDRQKEDLFSDEDFVSEYLDDSCLTRCSCCEDYFANDALYKSTDTGLILCEDCLLNDDSLSEDIICRYSNEDGVELGTTEDYAELITAVCDELGYEPYVEE